MRVLVLGGTGFVGRAISKRLNEVQGVETRIGARHRESVEGSEFLQIDATNPTSLLEAFADIDLVVNCVTGSGATIQDNATAIVDAAKGAQNRVRIVHMSSMAVYGNMQGVLDETENPAEASGWYGKAKLRAEEILGKYADSDGSSTMFRIGCVYGAKSPLWVDRIGLLLKSGRLGDLGTLADGWSNLVHVDDIAKAVVLSLNIHERGFRTYNLSAPDSPRWNSYFRDFALAIGCVPLRYKTRGSMFMESTVIAPPVKALERLSNKGWIKTPGIQSIPPSLLQLWRQQVKLDSSKIENELGMAWTRYGDGLKDSIDYFRNRYEC